MAKVNIFETNGAIGAAKTDKDGVVGIIANGVNVGGGFALGDILELYSLTDAESKGITEAYDSDNEVLLWHEVRDFYEEAGAGAKLYLMPVAKTVTLSQMADKANEYAAAMIEATKGEVRLIGLNYFGDAGTLTNGISEEVINAIHKAKELGGESFAKHRPVSFVIAGHAFTGDTSALTDLRADDGPNASRVSVSLLQIADASVATSSAAVGLLLGRMAAIPVQANAGRVKDGSLKPLKLKMGGKQVSTYKTCTQLRIAADKGYIVPRTYDNKPGYYIFDDPTCTPVTDDYAWVHRRRPMDKAHRITHEVFVLELLDDIDIDADTGQMAPAVAKHFQSIAETAIRTNMIAGSRPEISGVSFLVDPQQNVLATSKVQAKLRVVPKGMNREFEIEIGYLNPFNN